MQLAPALHAAHWHASLERHSPPVARKSSAWGVAWIGNDESALGHLRQITGTTQEFVLHACFATAAEAIAAIADVEVQVVLTEVALPDLCGIKCTKRLLDKRPELQVIVVSTIRDAALVSKAFAVGASHYPIKPFTQNQCLVDLRLAACAIGAARTPPNRPRLSPVQAADASPHPRLAPREEQILYCLAEGLPYKLIPERLHMSYSLFRKLLRRSYRKLGTHKGTEAVHRWNEGRGSAGGSDHVKRGSGGCAPKGT